jgi:GWxTD domain-containing protein
MTWRAAPFVLLTLALLGAALPVGAQTQWVRDNQYRPRGADTLSPVAVAESLAVLRGLDSVVRREPNNAEAWFRRGMIAWALAVRDSFPPPIRGIDWRWMSHMADTSFRRASFAAPDDARYALTTGRFLLSGSSAVNRSSAAVQFTRAIEIARRGDDAWVRADAAVEAGRAAWRRYDTFADRLPTTSGALRSLTAAIAIDDVAFGTMRAVIDAARDALQMMDNSVSGERYYREAETLFTEAYNAVPEHPRAFRELAMLLATKQRWPELALLARERVERTPWDHTAWMALGLATHRRGDLAGAAGIFSQALDAMPPEEYARLDRLERILRPRDSAAVAPGDTSKRVATTRTYWMFADPLWSQPGNEARVEFLARVAFAELRWTVEEMGVRGADSDRGDVHIRYGPPDFVLAWGPDDGTVNTSILWAYEKSDLAFVFDAPITYATARIPQADRAYIEALREGMPVRWDNTTRVTIDTLPVRMTRFRASAATADSVDVVIAALPPVQAIAAASSVREPVRTDLWILGDGMGTIYRDSTPVSSAGLRTWQQRVAAGEYIYRVEASAAESERAARASGPVVATREAGGFALSGFGVSDLLLATRARERRGVAPVRWSDLDVTPQVGTMRPGAALALVWETYGLGAQDGRAEYTVTITARRERGTVGRVTARILGGVSGRAGITAGRDQVVIQFDRVVAAAPIVVDYFDLSLAESPEGRYSITLAITDKATGRRTERTTALEIGR